MDDQRQRIQELHRRRREILAQELKAYLSPPWAAGLWVAIGSQASTPRSRPRGGKVLHFPSRNGT
ncbi:MAG: hypothetical protein ACM3ZA_14880 [Bacillota bacterium]